MQTKKTIDQILAKHPFFQGFAPEQIQLIAGCAQNAHFKADTYLFHEDGDICLGSHGVGDGETQNWEVRRWQACRRQ